MARALQFADCTPEAPTRQLPEALGAAQTANEVDELS